MILSISNWLTDRTIVWIAAGITCLGFIGPSLFGLSPPTYFASPPAVPELANTWEDKSTTLSIFPNKYNPLVTSAGKTMAQPQEGIGMILENPASDRDLAHETDKVGQKEQKDTTDITTARSDNNLSDRSTDGNIALLTKPAETLIEPNNRQTDLKTSMPGW